MTDKLMDFEATPGTGLASTTPAPQQVTSNGGTADTSALFVINGSTGARFISVANALNIARYLFTTNTTTRVSIAGGFAVATTPPTNFTTFLTVRNSSGPPLRLTWNPDNTISVRDNANSAASFTLPGTFTPGIGTGYYFTLQVTAGTTTSNGVVLLKVYSRDRSTVISQGSSSVFNTGTTAFAGGDIGVVNVNPAANTTVYFDYLTFTDGELKDVFPPAARQGRIKYYDGANWVFRPVKYYNGTAWIQKPLKYYNGTTWITTL